MMEDKKVAYYININTLFEYKDAANQMEKVYVKNAIFENPRTSHLLIMQATIRQTKNKVLCSDAPAPVPL